MVRHAYTEVMKAHWEQLPRLVVGFSADEAATVLRSPARDYSSSCRCRSTIAVSERCRCVVGHDA